VGHVGTGLTEQGLRDMLAMLQALQVDTSPFDEAVPREDARDVRWVRPTWLARSSTGSGRRTTVYGTRAAGDCDRTLNRPK